MDEFLSKPLNRKQWAIPGVCREFSESRLIACRKSEILVDGIKCLLPFLTEMEKMVVWDFYGLGGNGRLTLKQIAKRMNVSERAVLKLGVSVTKRVLRGLKIDAHFSSLLGRGESRPKKIGRPKKKSAAMDCVEDGSQE